MNYGTRRSTHGTSDEPNLPQQIDCRKNVQSDTSASSVDECIHGCTCGAKLREAWLVVAWTIATELVPDRYPVEISKIRERRRVG
jgi:hypothetical protein